MKIYVKIVQKDRYSNAILNYYEEDGSCIVSILLEEDINYIGIGINYFRAFQDLRKKLQEEEIKVCCQGARFDVYPSRMSQQMGAGLMAYVMRIGVPAKSEDLVKIFDEYKGKFLGTIEEQEKYHKKWLNFFKSN